MNELNKRENWSSDQLFVQAGPKLKQNILNIGRIDVAKHVLYTEKHLNT